MTSGPPANKARILPSPQAPLSVVLGSVHEYAENPSSNEKNISPSTKGVQRIDDVKRRGVFMSDNK